MEVFDLLDQVMDQNLDMGFYDIELKQQVLEHLLPYQIIHVQNLVYSLQNNNTAIDGSDTGTGKTYAAIAAAKQLGLKPFVICPKSVLNNWKKVCQKFSVRPVCVVNYETIRRGKTYDQVGVRVKSSHVQIQDKTCTWKLPRNVLMIFDEVHKCRDVGTLNAKILMAVPNHTKTLLLSATATDKPENFKVIGYKLNLYRSLRQAQSWINSTVRNGTFKNIHREIYPAKGARMKISLLGDQFPANQVSADCYPVDGVQEIDEAYQEIKQALELLQEKEGQDKKNALVQLLRTRQRVELMKVPILVELCRDYLENDRSVVIFVNFNQTLELLSRELKCQCLIWGKQTDEVRERNLARFQADQERIIICNIRAGGVGISLHDEHGNYPRVSLINPSFSSTDLVQALGRIHRAGSKTPALQRIVFAAKTVEEQICEKINLKLAFLSQINDGDLSGFTIE